MIHRPRFACRLTAAASILLAAVLCPAGAWAQCAMCSTAIGSSAGFARGFAISIIFLLSTLLTVIGGFVALVLSHTRVPRRLPRPEGPGQDTPSLVPPSAYSS